MIQKIAIIGLGLIGGSLAAAFKNIDSSFEITGFNRSYSAVEEALDRGFIDRGAESIADAVHQADFIFICMPVTMVASYVLEAAKSAKEGAIITDVGSTKASIVDEVENNIKSGIHFIGGHPMAGSEKHGVASASPTLFKNAQYVLTPTGRTDMEAYKRLHSLLSSTGANILAMEPGKHDKAVAVISHLPHMVAATLVNLASREAGDTENLLMLAAGGFKDTTRIAAGSPGMWIDICIENKDALLDVLDTMSDMIESLEHCIEEEDTEQLRDILEKAQVARMNLPSLPGKEIGNLYEIYIPVPDKPGVISDITLTIGQCGINIEDIEILHASDQAGILRLGIPGKEQADTAARVLSEKGYDVELARGR